MVNDIQSLKTKINDYEVTDPDRQLSAEEYNTLLAEVQRLSKRDGVVALDIPTPKLIKAGGQVFAKLKEGDIPEGLSRPYVGIKTFSRRKWRLTPEITGFGSKGEEPTPIEIAVSRVAKFNAGPFLLEEIEYDESGEVTLSAEVPLIGLFRSEFIGIGDIAQEPPIDPHEYKHGIPSSMRWDKLLLFTRRKRNVTARGEVGEDGFKKDVYTSSAHNTVAFALSFDGVPYLFKFDRTHKGDKQVVRRKYKIGLLWPKSFNEVGEPLFHDAISSKWTTVEVTAVVHLFDDKGNEYSIKILD